MGTPAAPPADQPTSKAASAAPRDISKPHANLLTAGRASLKKRGSSIDPRDEYLKNKKSGNEETGNEETGNEETGNKKPEGKAPGNVGGLSINNDILNKAKKADS